MTLAAFILALIASLAIAQDKPAHYKGLTLGTATEADLAKALGKAAFVQEATDEGPVKIHVYKADGREIWAIVRPPGKVTAITIIPAKYSKSDAEKEFGTAFQTVKYAIDKCSKSESNAIYESPTGTITILKYPALGVYVKLTKSSDQVEAITYTSGPYGHAKSTCPPAKK